MDEYYIQEFTRYGIVDLNKITKFTQGVKIIFKDYTGRSLPNLK